MKVGNPTKSGQNWREALAFTPGMAAGAIALAGAVTLAIAWAFQILGGYLPCPLCLQQRVPYYIAVPFAGLLAVAAPRIGPGVVRLGLAVIGAIFVWGTYLAAFHAGAEWGWWPGPADCAIDLGAVTDASGLLGQLQGFQPVRCDEAPWRMLGLSFAGWNLVISAGLATAASVAVLSSSDQPKRMSRIS